MRSFKYQVIFFLCFISIQGHAQSADSLAAGIESIPAPFYSKVEKKYASIDKDLSRKSIRYLKKMQRQEENLSKKLGLLDSTAITFNTDAADKYTGFIKSLSEKGKAGNVNLNQYNSYIDTLSTSLSFLKKFGSDSGKTALPITALDNLKDKLNQSEKISQFVSERKQQIQQLLSGYTKVPSAVQKEYDQLNKTAYYYKAQLSEYKSMLKDPKKIEEKTLTLLNKMPFFQKFLKENSQLASMFRLPSNGSASTAASLAGLQTRASVQGMIQQRIAAGGPNAMEQVQQHLATAHAEIDKLKDKISQLGGGGSDQEMPDFKPNTQKTKPLLKRLEYSADVQFAKSNNLLPSTANIGLGVGFKMDDTKSIGVGLAYKLGMGTIQHISFTNQAVGFRSYLDWKAPFGATKGKLLEGLYLTGDYEMNYNSGFKNIEQLKNENALQKSTLLGISKKYKITKKMNGEMKLLYDFLANKHEPVSSPVVLRLGYKF